MTAFCNKDGIWEEKKASIAGGLSFCFARRARYLGFYFYFYSSSF